LVTSLPTKAEPLAYSELHSHLSTHDFLHKLSSIHSSYCTVAAHTLTPSLYMCCTACLC
jgi:hypothetical protein